MCACNTIYTYNINMLDIFFDLLNTENEIFYIIYSSGKKQLPSSSFETVSTSWLKFEGDRTKLSSYLSFSSLAQSSSLSGQYSTSDPQSKL